MKHQIKYSEFNAGNGKWYCNDGAGVGTAANQWYTVPRLLNMKLETFVLMLIKEYKVSDISLKDNGLLIYSWDNYAEAHRFVLWVNRQKLSLEI